MNFQILPIQILILIRYYHIQMRAIKNIKINKEIRIKNKYI